MATKATLRRNGKRMVTVKVFVHLEASQLAVLLWSGLYDPDAVQERRRLSATRVRQAIALALLDSGRNHSYYIENDDEWEFRGGRDWALDQVMRVYGLTEADLDTDDRQRRAQPRVGDRIVNTCRGQYGYGARGTVIAARPDDELYVKYDDGTTQVAPVAWLARDAESDGAL